MADRHKQPRVYVRATPAQVAAWTDAAADVGVPLNTLAATALDSFVASLRTSLLRLKKDQKREARVQHPCSDSLCNRELGHKGRCSFGRPENS